MNSWNIIPKRFLNDLQQQLSMSLTGAFVLKKAMNIIFPRDFDEILSLLLTANTMGPWQLWNKLYLFVKMLKFSHKKIWFFFKKERKIKVLVE